MTDLFAPNPYTIRNHRLFHLGNPIRFLRSPNQSADFAPRGIILHDTAGRLEKGHAVNWFLKAEARASAHLTIERDGSVTQQVGFDRRAWHTGKSHYRDMDNVNAFAFGIELVNVGKCVKLRDSHLQSWFKERYRDGADGLSFAFASSKAHGKGWWLDYTEAQLRTLTALCQVLIARYDLSFVAGHWEISPGRKIDPNPLFPLQNLRTTLFGEKDDQAGPLLMADANLRRWPSYHDNIIKVLAKGASIHIIRSGTYNALGHPEIWHLVEADGQQGWLHHSLVDLGG
ncbi:N-acetylmuramoyl-L-alanine amidase [Cohaesibacter intestini]|uniref:N-acetylmuramoyl-L-alanine amidase n=1 Tax=Cohaesibacter intestini TaxID=2211145 RepID=UPI000DE86762|nr:N-acetylmuramoyl-L-alanine amidase [Cohaesibacter intestini]